MHPAIDGGLFEDFLEDADKSELGRQGAQLPDHPIGSVPDERKAYPRPIFELN